MEAEKKMLMNLDIDNIEKKQIKKYRCRDSQIDRDKGKGKERQTDKQEYRKKNRERGRAR